MFSKFTKSLNDLGKQVSTGVSNAAKSISEANQRAIEDAKKNDAAWFAEIANKPLGVVPMAAPQFASLLQAYQDAIGLNGMEAVIKDAARAGNGFTAAQIVQLVKADEVPLAAVGVAVWLYPRCVDPMNFNQVHNAFDIPASKQMLVDRLKTAPPPNPQGQAPPMAQGVAMAMPGVSLSITADGSGATASIGGQTVAAASMNMNAPTPADSMNAMNASNAMNSNVSVSMNAPVVQQGAPLQSQQSLEQRVAALEATVAALVAQLAAQGGPMGATVQGVVAQGPPMGGVSVAVGAPFVAQTAIADESGVALSSTATVGIPGGQVTHTESSFSQNLGNGFAQGSSESTSSTQTGTQAMSMNFGGMQMEGNATVTTTQTSSHSESSSVTWS